MGVDVPGFYRLGADPDEVGTTVVRSGAARRGWRRDQWTPITTPPALKLAALLVELEPYSEWRVVDLRIVIGLDEVVSRHALVEASDLRAVSGLEEVNLDSSVSHLARRLVLA